MNAMVQEMSWENVSALEGIDVSELSLEEIDEIMGGRWWRTALHDAAAAGAVIVSTHHIWHNILS